MVTTKTKSPELPIFSLTFSNPDELKEGLKNKVHNEKKEKALAKAILSADLKFQKDREFVIDFTQYEWEQFMQSEKLPKRDSLEWFRQQKKNEILTEKHEKKHRLREMFKGMFSKTKNHVERGQDIMESTKGKLTKAKETYEETIQAADAVKKGGIFALLTGGGATGFFGIKKMKEKITKKAIIHTKIKALEIGIKWLGWVPFLGSFMKREATKLNDQLDALDAAEKKELLEKEEQKTKHSNTETMRQGDNETMRHGIVETPEQKEKTTSLPSPRARLLTAYTTLASLPILSKFLKGRGLNPAFLRPGVLSLLGKFGATGVLSVGVVSLYRYLEKRPSLAEKKDSGSPSWWEKVIDEAGLSEQKESLVNFIAYKKIPSNIEDPRFEPLGEKIKKLKPALDRAFLDLQTEYNNSSTTINMALLASFVALGIEGNTKLITSSAKISSGSIARFANLPILPVALGSSLLISAFLLSKDYLRDMPVPKDTDAFVDWLDEFIHGEEFEELINEGNDLIQDKEHLMKIQSLDVESIRENIGYITGEKDIAKLLQDAGILGLAGVQNGVSEVVGSKERFIQRQNYRGFTTLKKISLKHDLENVDTEFWNDVVEIHNNLNQRKKITTQKIEKLAKLGEKIGITIKLDNDGYWSWMMQDQNTLVQEGPYRLCIDPELSTRQQSEKAARIVLDKNNFWTAGFEGLGKGGRLSLIQAKEMLTKNPESSLIRKAGDDFLTLTDGIKKKYLIPLEMGQDLIGMMKEQDPENKIYGSDVLVAYGSGLIPVSIYTFSKRVLTGYPTGGKLGFLGKVAFETSYYPLDAAKNTIRFGCRIVEASWDGLTQKSSKVFWNTLMNEYGGRVHSHFFATINKAKAIAQTVPGIGGFSEQTIERAKNISNARSKLLRAKGQLLSEKHRLISLGRDARKRGILESAKEAYRMVDGMPSVGLNRGAGDDVDILLKKIDTALKNLDVESGKMNTTTLKTLTEPIIEGAKRRLPLARLEKHLDTLNLPKEKVKDLMQGIQSNKKLAKNFSRLINIIPPAMAAYMIYDLHTSENKRQVAIEHTTFFSAYMLTYGGTYYSVKKFTPLKEPFKSLIAVSSAIGASLGASMGFDLGGKVESGLEKWGGGKFGRAYNNHLTNVATRLEIWAGALHLAKIMNPKVVEKTLLKTGIPKGIEIASKRILGPVLLKLSSKIKVKLIQKSLTIAGKQLGKVTAGAVASSWVPGLNIAMAIWTGVEVVNLGRMIHKAHRVNTLFKGQENKDIESMSFDKRTKNVLSDEYSKDIPGQRFLSLSEDEQTAFASKILGDEERFASLPYCHMTIKRKDTTSEVMEFEQGEPKYIHIKSAEDDIKLSENDLGKAEAWEAPKDYTPKNITETQYDDLDNDPGFANIYYATQALALREATGWTQSVINPLDTKNIDVMRVKNSERVIHMKRDGYNWKLIGANKKTLASGLDFHQALALANLNLYIDEFIEGKIYGETDDKWISENNKKDPFYPKKDKIIYEKDNARDIAIVGNDDGWLDFYTQDLSIDIGVIVGSLNTNFRHFEKS